ncbi:hypothetical protein K0504_01045 [Neiella marina]|uniref:Uncharacterized protein n=1 Tax=Neiella holothuriorum TaxID=2870530 RepID=A0ABS7EB99_9GAMM|nr:hypothetical protein [Neiella holothuriorum]MBW8189606.1 hypothetical protein [Neiella holothuriorum]
MDTIEQLLQYQAPEIICHPDGEGHVQVQVVANDTSLETPTPAELFQTIEQQALWNDWQQVAVQQSPRWLGDLMSHIAIRMKADPNQLNAWLSCFFGLANQDAQLTAISDISELPLADASPEQLSALMDKVEALAPQCLTSEDDDLSQYLEQCMVSDALEHLRSYL